LPPGPMTLPVSGKGGLVMMGLNLLGWGII
jgi:hypothetical protein